VASVVVDGLVVPIAVAGHPALDFCNTRAGWGEPRPKEYLHTHAHLTVWAREHDLVAPRLAAALRRRGERDPAAGAEVVARALAFRDALRSVLLEPAAGPAWVRVNREVRRAGAAATLEAATLKPATLTAATRQPGPPAQWSLDDGLERPLLAVVWSAAALLTSPAGRGVAACPGTGCGWIFADPRGRRRWCSMAWCGNRAKARRHAQRRRIPPT
jgi:predicted RNA-binding Zn ribbon-like protein